MNYELHSIWRKNSKIPNPSIFLYFEEIFEKLWNEHLSFGHGGRGRTAKTCQILYENVTFSAIDLLISCCLTCQQTKRANTVQKAVVQPIRSDNFLQ